MLRFVRMGKGWVCWGVVSGGWIRTRVGMRGRGWCGCMGAV